MRTLTRLLFLTVVLALSGMSVGIAAAQSLIICGASGNDCRTGSLSDVSHLGRSFELRRQVDPSTFHSPLPVAVTVIAMADSEVLWNGNLLARNGDPDGEGRSGRFVFTVIVPASVLRPGMNEATVRMRRPEYLWPISEPVHVVSVAPYGDPRQDALSRYLPALLIGSALAAAALWFGIVYIMDRTERGARLMALAATGAVIQLALETTRAFIEYRHIWQPPRLALIAVLGAFVGVMLVRYAAWRFAPAARNAATLICAVLSALVLLLAEGFDLKALIAFEICLAAIAALASWALYRGAKTAGFALAGALGALVWMVHDGTGFLDRGYYLALGAVVLALAVEQAGSARRRADPAINDPAGPAPSEPTLWRIITGARVRFEPVDSVALLTAADDYTEIGLIDGQTYLHTESLAQVVLAGAGVFVRVHRSHAVNRRLVRTLEPRPGGGIRLVLAGGFVVPVGRTFQNSVRHALAHSSRRKSV